MFNLKNLIMEVINITELTRKPKFILDKVSDKKEVVIIHRNKKTNIVMISFDEWNRLNNKEKNESLNTDISELLGIIDADIDYNKTKKEYNEYRKNKHA